MIKKLAVVCMAITFGNFASVSAQEPRRLGPGDSFEASLQAEATHAYTLELSAERFVYGIVDQRGVDVAVTVTGPDGGPVGRFDVPNRGPEPFHFTSEAAGVYRVEVATEDSAGEGQYMIAIKRLEPVAKTPAERVDQLMASYDNSRSPGAVIGVARDGKLIFAEGYGMANLAYDIPFTTDTRSNIGSVSKQFTAFAIALLAARGELSLDDPITEYLPELPEFASAIRIRNLLHHTSGLREAYNTLAIRGWKFQDQLRREQIFQLVNRQPELQFEPGSKFVYNNTGYIFLAEIVERVGGSPFDEWMDDNVFDPLGMTHTVIETEDGQVIPNRAAGYVHGEEGGYRSTDDLAESYGAGGIYTTVGDLAKWLENFHTAELGGTAVIDQMLEQGVLDNGDTLDYALGLFLDEQRGLARIQHGGADIAHRAMLAYYPTLDAGVIVMSNLGSFGSSIAYAVAEVFFGEHMEPEAAPGPTSDGTVAVNPELLMRYAGEYRMEGGGIVITFAHEDDRLSVQVQGQPSLQLVARSDSVFVVPSVSARVTFHDDDGNGPVERATFNQGLEMTLVRIDSWDPTATELEAFTGHYYSPELQTYYEVVLREDVLVIHNFATGDIQLTPTDVDTFNGSEFFMAKVEFQREKSGRVTGLYVSNGRTTDVWFERRE